MNVRVVDEYKQKEDNQRKLDLARKIELVSTKSIKIQTWSHGKCNANDMLAAIKCK